MYIFTANAADQIGMAGVAQAEVARKAEIDRHHLNKKINSRTPLRLPTAARIARAFAELTGMTQAEAMAQLFDQVLEREQ